MAQVPSRRRLLFSHPRVGAVAQPGEDPEPNEDVVVVVVRVVNAEPRPVARGPLVHQSLLQEEFRAPLDGTSNGGVPFLLRDLGERGQSLPPVEGPTGRPEAVPTAVLLLRSD